MSHAIAAAADLNAPPVTKILAEFVTSHPSQGWTPEVEHEAHRTFLNWLGCAIGAANHESVESSLAAIFTPVFLSHQYKCAAKASTELMAL